MISLCTVHVIMYVVWMILCDRMRLYTSKLCYTGQLVYMESSSDSLCAVHVIMYVGHSAKLKVAGLSPAEVHFFLLPINAALFR